MNQYFVMAHVYWVHGEYRKALIEIYYGLMNGGTTNVEQIDEINARLRAEHQHRNAAKRD